MDDEISTPRGPSGIIDDADFIVRHMLAAMAADGYLDVEMEDELDSHVCLLLADPEDIRPEVEGVQSYPGSYLRDQTHLLISPLMPVIGDNKLAKVGKVVLRFWDHLSGLELEVNYLGEARYHGLAAHRLSFPTRLIKHKNRYSLRAKVVGDFVLKAAVHLETGGQVVCPVVDIHDGGVSLEWSEGGWPVVGQVVPVELLDSSGAVLTLEGRVRFVAQTQHGASRCGIHFQELDRTSLQYQQLRQLVIQVGEYCQLYLRGHFADYLNG